MSNNALNPDEYKAVAHFDTMFGKITTIKSTFTNWKAGSLRHQHVRRNAFS